MGNMGSGSVNGKIDLVYCWCDGDDPAWKMRRQERLASLGMVYSPASDQNGDCRYEQLDELRYSLRSAAMHVPWVNHIYIVTDNQKPWWLEDRLKITIVDHQEIIPEELLPTFNSVTIEMYLDRIPGLSEKFIYGNDDFFFNRLLKPFDFFDGDSPIVWFERYGFYPDRLTKTQAKHLMAEEHAVPWGRTLLKAWLLFLEKNRCSEQDMPFMRPTHSFDAYTKTIFRAVKDKYPEMLKANAQPFRTNDEVMRVLIQYESVWTYGCKSHINSLRTKALRLRSHIWKPNMFSIYQETVERLQRQLEVYAPKAFCLNNIPREEQEEMMAFLDRKFSVKGLWE